MSRGYFSTSGVGNDFVMGNPSVRTILVPTPIDITEEDLKIEVLNISSELAIPVTHATKENLRDESHKLSLKNKIIVISIISVLVLALVGKLVSPYWYHDLFSSFAKTPTKQIVKVAVVRPDTPLYKTIPSSQLVSKMASLTSQPINIQVGSQTVAVSASTIASWISVTTNKSHSKNYLLVNPATVSSSLVALANQHVVAPVDSITVSESGVQTTILAGQNGTELASAAAVSAEGQKLANSLLTGGGGNISAPVVVVPSKPADPATEGKVLDTNVTTKEMYVYDNGQLVNTFPVTAGAADTPTPLGEFHIWDKLTEQTMTGYNPNGTKYIQPNVQWINYFDHSGDAVHGNYWRPASYFGAVNSSHGCVGLQDAAAEWVYNWAPIGTTVINHA